MFPIIQRYFIEDGPKLFKKWGGYRYQITRLGQPKGAKKCIPRNVGYEIVQLVLIVPGVIVGEVPGRL